MLAVFLLAVALSQGLVGAENTCETFLKECAEHLDKEAFENLQGLPDADELRQICPGTKSFLRCLQNYPTECGNVGSIAWILTGPQPDPDLDVLIQMVDMVCNEESNAHKLYVEHAGCVTDVLKTKADKCFAGTGTFMRSFMKHQEELVGEIDEETAQQEFVCIGAQLITSCLTMKTKENCGEEASAIVGGVFHELEIVKDLCSGAEGIEEKKKLFFETIPDVEAFIEELFGKRK